MTVAEEEGRNGGEMGDVPPIILRFRNLVENNCGFVVIFLFYGTFFE
jgi:hypothetical protein